MDALPLNFRLNVPLYAPRPTDHSTPALPCLSPSLPAAKNVYVRQDGTKGPHRRSERISVDRIKPAFFLNPFQPVIQIKPPPRGRPPAKQSHPSRSHPSDSSTASKHQTSSRTGGKRGGGGGCVAFGLIYHGHL